LPRKVKLVELVGKKSWSWLVHLAAPPQMSSQLWKLTQMYAKIRKRHRLRPQLQLISWTCMTFFTKSLVFGASLQDLKLVSKKPSFMLILLKQKLKNRKVKTLAIHITNNSKYLNGTNFTLLPPAVIVISNEKYYINER